MNKHFLIGIISTLVGFMIYDIVRTIKVRREIERNKLSMFIQYVV